MNNLKPWDLICNFIGLFSGGVAYLNFHILGINWSHFSAQLAQLAWTLIVTGATVLVSTITKKLIEDHWPQIKSRFKSKKK